MTKEFELKDTSKVQEQSLILFMQNLSYVPSGTGWKTENKVLKANTTLSHSTAIKLHNLKRDQWKSIGNGWWKPEGLNISLAVSTYGLVQLFAKKLVHKVKIQHNRRSKNRLTVQSYMVKLNDKHYAEELGLV